MNSAAHARYSTGAIVLHWVTALLVIFMIVFGEELVEGAEHDAAAGTFLPSIHVSVGVTILVLTLRPSQKYVVIRTDGGAPLPG